MDVKQFKTVAFIILVLGSIATIVLAESDDVFERPTPEDPWFDSRLPPQRPGFYNFLRQCIQKTTRSCGVKVFNAIFAKEVVKDPTCCNNIIKAKYICNRSLSYLLVSLDKFKGDKDLIHTQSNAIYDHCAKIASS